MAISYIGTDSISGLGYGFKNRIINGAMMIDQRNAGASVSLAGVSAYTVDRFQAVSSPASKFTVQQNAGSVTPPTGFKNYLGATSSAATSISSGDYYFISQPIEGLNVSDLGWGAVGASSVTISFKVYSSLTGTFGGALRNGGTTRSYPFSYAISSPNTWTSISITIPGDTTGTWPTDNTKWGDLIFSLGMGSTYTNTAGSWAAGNYASATGTVNVVSTNGATFYITGVQLEKGNVATSFDYRPYGTELALCQRYYYQTNNFDLWGTPANTTQITMFGKLGVPMRSTPTATLTPTSSSVTNGITGTKTSATAPTVAGLTATSYFVAVYGGFSFAAGNYETYGWNGTSFGLSAEL